MKIIEFLARIMKITKNLEISCEKHANHENTTIKLENHGNHEIIRIPFENHKHH